MNCMNMNIRTGTKCYDPRLILNLHSDLTSSCY